MVHAIVRRGLLVSAALAALGGARAAKFADVDETRIAANAASGNEWPSVGFDYSATRFSPLTDVSAANVGQLGLAWHYQFDTDRGQEATPLVVDGTLYTTTTWSKVFAFDAATGAPKWSFDPKVRRRGRLQGLLRRGQPRRRGLEGQGLCRHHRAAS